MSADSGSQNVEVKENALEVMVHTSVNANLVEENPIASP